MSDSKISVGAIVTKDLKRRHLDGLYNPCRKCKGCSLAEVESRACLCSTCLGGKLLEDGADTRIVSPHEYNEIMRLRAEAEKARIEAERAEAKRLKAIEVARKKAERAEARRIKAEVARAKRIERREIRRARFEKFKATVARRISAIAARLKKWAWAIGRAVHTSIICRFLVGVSTGSVLLSAASIAAFHFLKSDWMLHASVGEVKGALYLFQKLFLFEAVYVFVIVAFTLLLIIARLIDGSWKDDDETADDLSEQDDQDGRFLD